MRNTICTAPSPPRDLTITRVFQDGIELNWIPPRETNGDIQHYIIKYTTQNLTEQDITTTDNTNYYNLTGLERGQTYKITVVAVNSAGTSERSEAIAGYRNGGTGGGGQSIDKYKHTYTEQGIGPGTTSNLPPTTTAMTGIYSTIDSHSYFSN